MKKIIALLTCLLISFGLVGTGCDSSNPYGNKTVLRFPYVSSGLGTSQDTEFKKYFEEKYKETSFAEGKMGVYLELVPVTSIPVPSKNSAYDIFSLVNTVNQLEMWVGNGAILDLTEIISEKSDTENGEPISIKERIQNHGELIDASSKLTINGEDHYYSVPTVEFYPGLTYDVQTFNRNGFYFADTYIDDDGVVQPYDYDAVYFPSDYVGKDFYFTIGSGNDTEDTTITKSVGPDGKPSTDDDGLPATLEELLVLCEYMKSKGVSAINMAGKFAGYKNFLLEALYFSLLGPQQAETSYAFDGGNFDIVVGFEEDELLFPGIDYIKKPIVKTIKLTGNNGYYVSWSAAKYYALAFSEIYYREKLYFEDSFDSSKDQRNVMYSFIYNGYLNRKQKQIGMLAESSFWYREAEAADYHNEFKLAFNDGHVERNYRFMALPISVDGDEDYISTYNPDRKNTVVDHYRMVVVASSTAANDPEKYAAIKAYIQTFSSGYWLNKYQSIVGTRSALEYEKDDNIMSGASDYFQKLEKLVQNSHVVYFASKSQLFSNMLYQLQIGYGNLMFSYDGYGRDGAFLHILHKETNKRSAEEFFKQALVDRASFYKMAVDQSKIEPSYDEDGNEIVFAK